MLASNHRFCQAPLELFLRKYPFSVFLLRSSRDASTTARLSGRPAEPGVPAADADAAADGDVADDWAPAPAGLPLTLVVFNGFRVVVAVHMVVQETMKVCQRALQVEQQCTRHTDTLTPRALQSGSFILE